MNDPETYDAVVIGGGKGGKTLAMYLARENYKVAMIERDPMMVGGGCINVACIPTKTSLPALDLFIPFGAPQSSVLRWKSYSLAPFSRAAGIIFDLNR